MSQFLIEKIKTKDDLIAYIKNRCLLSGSYVALPEAVHIYECNFWRIGQSHGPCTCGGEQLQAEIDAIFGTLDKVRKTFRVTSESI